MTTKTAKAPATLDTANDMVPVKTKCTMVDDNYLVQPYEPPQMKSAGGILLLPNQGETSMKHKPNGYVLAVGPGKPLNDGSGHRLPMAAKVGDRIVFASGSGQEIRFDGRYLKIVRSIDVLMVLE